MIPTKKRIGKIPTMAEFKEIWSKLMEDLIYATHCHFCGERPQKDAYGGEFCCKRPCWKAYMGAAGCFFGGEDKGCRFCLEQYAPSLRNDFRMRGYYGLNPMGSGKKFAYLADSYWSSFLAK